MDLREFRSVAMSIILKQRVCRMLHDKQEIQTSYPSYSPINHNRSQSYQYKEIDVSTFDALFEGKPIEDISDIVPVPNFTTIAPSKLFNNKSRYKHVKDRDFFKNCRKTVSQLILYWETVWMVGKVSARRCAGWDW